MERYVIIEKIDITCQTVVVKVIDTRQLETFKVDKELMETLYLLAEESEKDEYPAVVLMNDKNQFVL